MNRSMLPLAALLAVETALPVVSMAQTEAPRVIDSVHVFDGTGAAPIEDGRLVLVGDQITCVGTEQSCPVPPNTERLDVGAGSWVLPGLIDSHVHFAQTGWFTGRPDTLDLTDVYPYEETQAELKSNPDRYLRSYLCSGVTGVFDVGGFPWSWDLRRVAENSHFAPHVSAAGPLITHAPRVQLNLPGEQEMLALSNEQAGREAVRYMAAFETDAIKVWYLRVAEGQENEIDSRFRAVADEARQQNTPLIVHATTLREAKVALSEQTHLLVHGVDDELVDEEFLELARAAGTIYSPTLLVSDGYLQMFEAIKGTSPPTIDDPNRCIDVETRERVSTSSELASHPTVVAFDRDLEAYRERLAQSYNRKVENLRRVHRAGIPIALGTDAGNPGTFHGPSVYRELEAMQASGIEANELLVMATSNGARAMRRDDIGALVAGRKADLIVLTNNPLEDIRNLRSITHVMRAGRLHSIRELSSDNVEAKKH